MLELFFRSLKNIDKKIFFGLQNEFFEAQTKKLHEIEFLKDFKSIIFLHFVFILFLEMVLNSAGKLYHFEKTTINIFYYSFFRR